MALGSVAVASIGVGLALATLPPPSPGLLENIALIGATLVLAYVVEAVWLVPRVEVDGDREEWLGFLVGTGIAGLLGVVFALLASEHRAAGHDNWLDAFGLAWAAVSLLILGGLLVIQPLLADRFDQGGAPGPGASAAEPE